MQCACPEGEHIGMLNRQEEEGDLRMTENKRLATAVAAIKQRITTRRSALVLFALPPEGLSSDWADMIVGLVVESWTLKLTVGGTKMASLAWSCSTLKKDSLSFGSSFMKMQGCKGKIAD